MSSKKLTLPLVQKKIEPLSIKIKPFTYDNHSIHYMELVG